MTRVVTFTRRCLHGGCWCARCADCGEKLTHCDYSEDAARKVAEAAGHECRTKGRGL